MNTGSAAAPLTEEGLESALKKAEEASRSSVWPALPLPPSLPLSLRCDTTDAIHDDAVTPCPLLPPPPACVRPTCQCRCVLVVVVAIDYHEL
jgi:hypothetical protein